MKNRSLSLSSLSSLLSLSSLIIPPLLGAGCRGAGDGHVVDDARTVAAFHQIETSASVPVDVAFAVAARVDVRIDDNLRDLLVTDVHDDTLFVSTSDVLFPAADAVVTVRIPEEDDIALVNRGSGALHFAGRAHRVTATSTGSGSSVLEGNADSFRATLSGSAPIDAAKLTATDAILANSGSGTISANVSGTVSITLTGSGDVRVTGAATATESSDTGSGSIVRE
jgi:hypothetical protein